MNFDKQFFKTDESGKPIARYKIRTELDANGKSRIQNPDHSALVVNHLKKISKEMDRLFNVAGSPRSSIHESVQAMERIEALESTGRKLAGQAFYLDTADRNDWATINMVVINKSGNYVECPSKLLSKLWHGALEAYLEEKAEKRKERDSDFNP